MYLLGMIPLHEPFAVMAFGHKKVPHGIGSGIARLAIEMGGQLHILAPLPLLPPRNGEFRAPRSTPGEQGFDIRGFQVDHDIHKRPSRVNNGVIRMSFAIFRE